MTEHKESSVLARFASPLLILATIIWGSSFVVMKSSVDVLPTFWLLAIRFSFAALVLAVVFIRRWKVLDKQYLIGGTVMGFCLFLAYTFQTFGLELGLQLLCQAKKGVGAGCSGSANYYKQAGQFPCKKYLVKGNHDYWWSTVSKMKNFFTEKGLTTLDFLHNNCALYGDYALCGTRGWFFEEDQKPHNAKVLNREVGRLETSLKAAEGRSIFCFLHYPPLYQGYECPEILRLLSAYPVERCCYGHLHGYAIKRRLEGGWNGTDFSLISADYLGFVPKKICE